MANKNSAVVALPQPIDIRYKFVKRPFCKRKVVETTLSEQKHLKKTITMICPDSKFYDDLNEDNSIQATDSEYIPYIPNDPINLIYRYKQNLFGRRKRIETNSQEQSKLKKVLIKIFPDCKFYDYLESENSVIINNHRKTDPLDDPFYAYDLAMEIFERENDDIDEYEDDTDNDFDNDFDYDFDD